MTAFSIILRILTLGACGAAVFLWLDKQNLVAQKEAIIQEQELLIGYPKDLRKKGDEVTQSRFEREINFAKMKESRPDDASFVRLQTIRQELVNIQGNEVSNFYGHKGKKILGQDGYKLPAEGEDPPKDENPYNDPNAYLSLRGHIGELTQDVLAKIKTIEARDVTIEELEEDLNTQKTLLGQEIEKVTARDATIQEKDKEITDMTNKYEQLQETYNQNQLAHQEKIDQLKMDLAKQKQALQLQVNNLTQQLQETNIKVQDLMRENQTLARQNMQADAGTPGIPGTPQPTTQLTGAPAPTPAPDNPLLAGAPPSAGSPGGNDPGGSGIFGAAIQPINTKFLMFSAKTNQIALLGGQGSGVEKLQGKKLDLVVGGKRLAALSIVKIDKQYTLFLVRQSKSAPEYQQIASLAKMAPVTINAH